MSEELQSQTAAAQDIYQLSENSLMAHTVRATTQLFVKKNLRLDVQIEPDREGMIEGNAISCLLSYINESDLVTARIMIREDASRHLARFCIAHEVYHLLLQLADYEKLGIWPTEQMTRHEEDACDGFAWHLCRRHNDFYFDEKKLEECRFSDKAANFPGMFRTHNFKAIAEWPRPFVMNPKLPFWRPRTS